MTDKIKSFKDLIVWQKSIILAKQIYNLTTDFPKEEVFGLTSQIKRSAVSIASNIAEGTGRSSRKDYRQFLFIAYGSSLELETQIILSKQLGFTKDTKEIDGLIIEIQKMLTAMIGKLK